ncbi:MAG: O-antigen ligase family protein [Candidatus Moranbacteria bacterium]|nr:O-antigen ligase family protein [Candidatus Moranbacteria bacterium]
MPNIHKNLYLSQETLAAVFVMLFTSVFIVAQLVIGFQLSLFAVAMLVSAVLIFWRPRAGLYASTVLTLLFERFYTLQPILVGRASYKLYPIDIFLGVVFVAVAIRLVFRRTSLRLRSADWLLIGFLAFITALFAKDLFVVGDGSSMSTAFSTWKNYFFYGLLYFAVPLLLQNEERLSRFVKVFLAGSVTAILFVVIGIARGEGLWTQFTPLSTDGVRILALPHAYYFSMALLAVVFSLRYIRQRYDAGSRVAFLLFASLPFWMVGIVGSLMRHLWIGVIFSVGMMWFILPKASKQSLMNLFRVSLLSFIAVGIVVAYGIALFPYSQISTDAAQIGTAVSNRLLSLGDSGDTSISWRTYVWREATEAFVQSPVLGTGFGARIPVEIDTYREFIEIRNVHNSWLAMLVQIGVVGFGLILFFIGKTTAFVRKNIFRSEFLNSVRYATLGVFFFQCMVFLYQPYLETNLLGIFFWLNLGVMRTLSYIADTDASALVRAKTIAPSNLPVI